jgi:hypothetical protein
MSAKRSTCHCTARDPEHLRIALCHATADAAVEAPCAAVQTAEALLHGAILHDHELPVLLVRARRRAQRELDQMQDQRVVDRVGLQTADRTLRPHRVLEDARSCGEESTAMA